jgi:hypothetical protein
MFRAIGLVPSALPELLLGLVAAAVGGWMGTSLAMPVYACPVRRMDTSTQCRALEKAAELYTNLEDPAVVCPTLDDLVSARLIMPSQAWDPWGTAYALACVGDAVRARSAGPDRRFQTRDDVDSDPRQRVQGGSG